MYVFAFRNLRGCSSEGEQECAWLCCLSQAVEAFGCYKFLEVSKICFC